MKIECNDDCEYRNRFAPFCGYCLIEILREEKANQKEKIHIRYDQIRDLIPRNISFEETTEYIKTALRFYQEAHAKK